MKNLKNQLYLGSKSASRQMLLRENRIPFSIVSQDADETQCDYALPLDQLVAAIALHKMGHVILPSGKEDGDVCFVLTSDTLSQDKNGTVHGKPVDRADAIAKIKSARDGSRLCTAFCLDKRVWRAGGWAVEKRITKRIASEYLFYVPDAWIETYLDNSIGMQASNAIAIEGYGAQFLKSVHGSYSTIVGLPMFELREALEEIGFF
jgi:septum formation protein